MSLGRQLADAGWQGKAIGLAIEAGQRVREKFGPKDDGALARYMGQVECNPKYYLTHTEFGDLARHFLQENQQAANVSKREYPLPYKVYGAEFIDENTIEQMNDAMRLEPVVGGALMPDAHLGYGLPVGGVWALDNAVSPWAVGVDIACRMRLTVFRQASYTVGQRRNEFKRAIEDHTRFGAGSRFTHEMKDHPVMDDPRWSMNSFTKRLRNTVAGPQLGSSGGGNHFVEFGALKWRGMTVGINSHLALLSHSGSRRVGFDIANRYAKIAEQECAGLDSQLGFLSLDSEAGAEYWEAMNLAGDYAAANHEVIHRSLTEALGLEVVRVVENHHNFAWVEEHSGREVIVHRKGATPAGQGVRGIIPGTMADKGYIVSGRGNAESLDSASHGAGRTMSRRAAKRSLSNEQWRATLQEKGISLIGGSLDEAPGAYKDIERVIEAQSELVDVVAEFQPTLVRMAEDGGAY